MSTYIIIGLVVLVVRLAYVNWQINKILTSVHADRLGIYNRYLDTFYTNCQNIVVARELNSNVLNIIGEIIPSVSDEEKQELLRQFAEALEQKQRELNMLEKNSQEFMVKYEIEKLTGRI
jgi:hypothetical protein